MTDKIIYRKTPSIYIPPVSVGSDELEILELSEDSILKIAKVYQDNRFSGRGNWRTSPVILTRWLIQNRGGLPITFTSKVTTLQDVTDFNGGEEMIKGKYDDGREWDGVKHTYWHRIGQWFPYQNVAPDEFVYDEVTYDYIRSDKMANERDKANKAEFDKAKKVCDDHITELQKMLAANGYLFGDIDFDAVSTAIAEQFREAQ